MRHPDYPGVSSMVTRHGKIRWRYRKSGQKDVMLPGEPQTEEFDEAYQRAILGQSAAVIQYPTAGHPRSMKAAYRLLKASREWKALDQRSRTLYQKTTERVLATKFGSIEWGDGPIADLKRSHIKKILDNFAHAPHMERLVLICLRKMIMIALEEEWIENDPTYKMTRNPHTDGHKAWTPEVMAKFEARWKIGTHQRTAYALALWLGNRVSDVVRLRWSDLVTKHIAEGEEVRAIEGFEFVQHKGRSRGKSIFLPMTPMLARELAPLSRSTETVLASPRGTPYKEGTISTKMAEWCEKAGIGPGYSMHGLRKALGVKLAEADASTRQLMETLGHNNIAYAELYSREASQMRLAVQAMDKVTQVESARKRAALKVVK